MPKNREQHLLSDLAAMEADYLSGTRGFEAFLDRWAKTISEIQTALTEDFLSDHAIELISDTFNIVLAPAARVHQAICQAESGIVDDVAGVLADLALFSQEEEGDGFIEEPDPPNPLQEWLIANISHPFATSPEVITDFLELIGLDIQSFEEWLSEVRENIGWNKLADQLVNGDRVSMQKLVQIVLDGCSNASKELFDIANSSSSQILELKSKAATYSAFPMPAWFEEALRQLEKIRDSPDYHFTLDDLDECLCLEDDCSFSSESPGSPHQGDWSPIASSYSTSPVGENTTPRQSLKRKRATDKPCLPPLRHQSVSKLDLDANHGYENAIDQDIRPGKRRHLGLSTNDDFTQSTAVLYKPLSDSLSEGAKSFEVSSPSSASSAASSPLSNSSGSESGSPTAYHSPFNEESTISKPEGRLESTPPIAIAESPVKAGRDSSLDQRPDPGKPQATSSSSPSAIVIGQPIKGPSSPQVQFLLTKPKGGADQRTVESPQEQIFVPCKRFRVDFDEDPRPSESPQSSKEPRKHTPSHHAKYWHRTRKADGKLQRTLMFCAVESRGQRNHSDAWSDDRSPSSEHDETMRLRKRTKLVEHDSSSIPIT